MRCVQSECASITMARSCSLRSETASRDRRSHAGAPIATMHVTLCATRLARQPGTTIFPKRSLPKERWDAAAMAQAKKEIEKHLGILETQLRGKDYLVGDRYSLVEVCYTPFVEFLPLMEITPPPAVAGWVAHMLE